MLCPLRLAVLLFAGALAVPQVTAHPKVHFVIVADTADKDTGADSRGDLATVLEFSARVTEAGIPVEVREVTGENFSCSSILSAVSELRVRDGDTVIFYYSGHGMRTPTSGTKFPEFACNRDGEASKASLSSVVDLVGTKKPRLIIAIADTCNEEKRQSPTRASFHEEGTPQNLTRAMKHLFLEYSGIAVLSAAIPGQLAWGDGAGSYFTRQFFRQSIPRVINAGDGIVRPRWEAIIVDALRDIDVPSDPPAVQYPQVATWGLAEHWPAGERVSPAVTKSDH
jgi:hypothetical protein